MIRKGASYFPGDGGGKSSGFKCRVILLDGADMLLDINKKTPGQLVFDHILRKLDILERDYFGLLYEDEQKCQQWLDLMKPIKKQTKKNHSQVFFCVKFYPVNPMTVTESTRAQLYWQVKRDFMDGRLPCTAETAIQLSAYMAQVELGDWEQTQLMEYLSQLALHKKDLLRLQDSISVTHQTLRGMSCQDARSEFLKIMTSLEFYGMILFNVRYEEKIPYLLGISPFGLSMCKEFVIIQSYKWSKVVQVVYKGKKFIVKVRGDWATDSNINSLHFDVDSSKTCKDLYNTFVEHINFYISSKRSLVFGKPESNIFSHLPTSSSSDGLSQHLEKGKTDNSKKKEERHLQRSLSLPRSAKNKIDLHQSLNISHPSPHPTNTTVDDPVLKALLSRSATHMKNKSEPSSPTSPTETVSSSIQSEGSTRPNSLGAEVRSSDIQSMNSMHDSLLDLAYDLGNNDDDKETEHEQKNTRKGDFVILDLESSPAQKTRSSSLPQIALHSIKGPEGSSITPDSTIGNGIKGKISTDRTRSVELNKSFDDKKHQNRLLVRSWVKEQKKKDQSSNHTKMSPQPHTERQDITTSPPSPHLPSHTPLSHSPSLPPLSTSPSLNGCSPFLTERHNITISPPSPHSPILYRRSPSLPSPQLHKLKSHSPIPTKKLSPLPSSLYRPNSANISRPEDLYSVPRPSPAPSPSLYHKPHPFSISAYSSLHSVNDITTNGSVISSVTTNSHNDYDIPRSLTDLCRIDSPFLGNRSDKSVNGQTGYVIRSRRGSSSSEPMSQINMLKDEYPDYDFPKPNEYPDYDVPKPHRSLVAMEMIDSGGKDDDNVSFGALDNIMAEINLQVEQTHLLEKQKQKENKSVEENQQHQLQQHLCSPTDILKQETDTEKHILLSSEDSGFSSHQGKPSQTGSSNIEVHPLHCLTHQPLSYSGNHEREVVTKESGYDRLSAQVALQKLKEDGIVDQDVFEQKGRSEEDVLQGDKKIDEFSIHGSEELLQNPSHLVDLTNHLELEELLQDTPTQSMVQKSVPGLPFDPNFFVRQVALEQVKQKKHSHSSEQNQLPLEVARFMNWVKQKSSDSSAAHKKTASADNVKETSIGHVTETTSKRDDPQSLMQQDPIYQEIPDTRERKKAFPTHQKSKSLSTTKGLVIDPSTFTSHKTDSGNTSENSQHSIDKLISQSHDKEPSEDKLSAKENSHIITPVETENEGPNMEQDQKKRVNNSVPLRDLSVNRHFSVNMFDRKRLHSFNARHPLQVNLPPPSSNGDESSIPNSPSFYTKHPHAAAMPRGQNVPHGQHQGKFQDHLSNLDSSAPGTNHRVMNWMQTSQNFWETRDSRQGGGFAPSNSSQLNRSLTVSHSVHSPLERSVLQDKSKSLSNRPSKFKDHLYEELDNVQSAIHEQQKQKSSVMYPQSHSRTGYPRFQISQVPGSLPTRPYITVELPRSRTGGKMFATDV